MDIMLLRTSGTHRISATSRLKKVSLVNLYAAAVLVSNLANTK